MSRMFSDPFTVSTSNFNFNTYDEDGSQWFCDIVDGWDETVDPVVEISTSGYADGGYASEFFPIGPRYMEVQGVVVAEDRDKALKAFRTLNGLFQPNVYRTARRYGPFNEQLTVRAASKVEKIIDLGHSFRWKVTLVAPWPYKTTIGTKSGESGAFTGKAYSTTYPRIYPRLYTPVEGEGVGSADVQLLNNGNATAYPIIEVTGPLTANSWQVVNTLTDQYMSFANALSAGQTLVVDTRARTAKIGGVDYDYYIRGDWLNLPAGQQSVFRLLTGVANPSARLKVTMSDTWR